jgi:hypothetical protein
MHPTGGLRPPLFCCRANVRRRKTDFCDVHTHVHKSGGRQPAVVGKPNAVRRKSPTIRRRRDARTRAAGVSPPWWSVNRTRCGENRPPFDDDATHEQERRASARRVFGRSNDVRDFSQITCKCVPHTTAGLRQPLLIAPRPFGAEYDIWDVQTHAHKSGGRQPAVVFVNCVCNCNETNFRVSRSHRMHPTGGLRPPLFCCRANVRRRKTDFCDVHTHAHKSGGRQPAVCLVGRMMSAISRRSLASAFPTPRLAYASRS